MSKFEKNLNYQNSKSKMHFSYLKIWIFDLFRISSFVLQAYFIIHQK